jgi:hypothetical protein
LLAPQDGIEVVERRDQHRHWLFILNHDAQDKEIELPVLDIDILTGQQIQTKMILPPKGTMVLRKKLPPGYSQNK